MSFLFLHFRKIINRNFCLKKWNGATEVITAPVRKPAQPAHALIRISRRSSQSILSPHLQTVNVRYTPKSHFNIIVITILSPHQYSHHTHNLPSYSTTSSGNFIICITSHSISHLKAISVFPMLHSFLSPRFHFHYTCDLAVVRSLLLLKSYLPPHSQTVTVRYTPKSHFNTIVITMLSPHSETVAVR